MKRREGEGNEGSKREKGERKEGSESEESGRGEEGKEVHRGKCLVNSEACYSMSFLPEGHSSPPHPRSFKPPPPQGCSSPSLSSPSHSSPLTVV